MGVCLSTDAGRTWTKLGRAGGPITQYATTFQSCRATFLGGSYQYTLLLDPVVEPADLFAMLAPTSVATTSLTLANPGNGQPVTYTASFSPSVSWATVVSPSGTMLGALPLRINSAGLPTGTYSTTLQVDALVTTTGRTIPVPVTMRVADRAYRVVGPVVLNSQIQGW